MEATEMTEQMSATYGPGITGTTESVTVEGILYFTEINECVHCGNPAVIGSNLHECKSCMKAWDSLDVQEPEEPWEARNDYSDDAEVYASIGWGTDEDYGNFGGGEEY